MFVTLLDLNRIDRYLLKCNECNECNEQFGGNKMKFELRTNLDGTSYYSFVYYDRKSKRTVRIPREQIKSRFGNDIVDKNKAMEICKILETETDSLKKRMISRVEWEKEFYNFEQILSVYENYQKKKAPNSWKNNIHYLKYYVLPFFLNIKNCSNLLSWSDYYEEFKIWLEDEAYLIKNPEKLISYASKNHAIKALNTFIQHLYIRRILPTKIQCECFPSKNLNEKGAEEIITLEEMEAVYSTLKEQGNELEAIFFRFLYFTGMRFNEGLGIHSENIYEGEIEDSILKKHLNNENISYFGYVVFDSQPAHETRGLREEDGSIKRKPLKGKHKIDYKSARTVVITDKALWNDLVVQHNKIIDLYHRGDFGNDLTNYPLFEGIDKTTSIKRLKNAFTINNLKTRTWHSCRHTRATMLIGETGNSYLARLWLGHSSENVLKRYVHIYEATIRNLKKTSDDGTKKISKLNLV